MIEPISLFSAIAGVTNLASRLTIDLTRLSVTLKNVPGQITQVCNEMVSLNATLTALQQRFNPMASGYSQEQLLCLETVISSTRETLVQLAKLSDASEATGKKKTAKTGIWKKVTWTLNESEISSYRSGLVSYTTMLNLLTASLADQRGANIEAMVTRTNTMLESLIEDRKRLSIVPAESVDIAIPHKLQGKQRQTAGRTRSNGASSEFSESRKIKDVPRSRSVAPAMSRGASSSVFTIESGAGGSSRAIGTSHRDRATVTTGMWKSASTSHLPLPDSSAPPLPNTARGLRLDIPSGRKGNSRIGLQSPPPEYTETAPGVIMDDAFSIPPSPAPRSERQIIRPTNRSRAGSVSTSGRSSTVRSSSANGRSIMTTSVRSVNPSARPTTPSERSVASRPTYQRALSSVSAAAVEAVSVPIVPPPPSTEGAGGHKLEFAGQWRVREIRLNDALMGPGMLHLKKDDVKKRVLVNLKLDSSKNTRLSYRWIDSSSATKTKPPSMFGGPSYVFRSLVRADDYSGTLSSKTVMKLEDITYLAGQRSLMLSLNLIQQSPAEWLVDTKPTESPNMNFYGTDESAYMSPPMTPSGSGGRSGGFFTHFRAPSTPSLVSQYPPSESIYADYSPQMQTNNFLRPSHQSQNMIYSRAIAPPTPPLSPSESPTSDGRRPSIGSSVATFETRMLRSSSHDRPPPIPPKIFDVRMRGADRSGDPNVRHEDTFETEPSRKERQRSRKNPASWFSSWR